MKLITRIEINNFRSSDSLATDTGALTAYIGTNGSGKSNILRALNLFFNGELEPGVGLPPGEARLRPPPRAADRLPCERPCG